MKTSKFMLFSLFFLLTVVDAEYQCDTTLVKADTFVNCTTRTKNNFVSGIETFKNKKRHGLLTEWYKNGQIRYIEKFKDGCPIDTSYGYFPDGKLKSLIPYKKCKREGLRVIFSPTGDTLAKGNAHNGKSIGTHYAWYPNKNKKSITRHNSTGQKHGLSQSWRKDGTKKDSIVYTNGDMTEVRTYYTDGSQRMWEKYKNDKLWSGVYHGPDGKKTGVVKKGNGECVLFGEDGKYASRRVYKNGVKVEEEWLEEE